jgi:hypothetical protein
MGDLGVAHGCQGGERQYSAGLGNLMVMRPRRSQQPIDASTAGSGKIM